jgi:hypothetical protein
LVPLSSSSAKEVWFLGNAGKLWCAMRPFEYQVWLLCTRNGGRMSLIWDGGF